MSATVQRQRRKRALASFLADPYIDGVHQDFYGAPSKAPKRWKRLWARQWRQAKAWKANAREAQRVAAQKDSRD